MKETIELRVETLDKVINYCKNHCIYGEVAGMLSDIQADINNHNAKNKLKKEPKKPE